MKITEFYADPDRKASGEVELATGWTSEVDPGATFSIFWVQETAEVYALRHGPQTISGGLPKPYLVDVPKVRTVGREDQEITVLGTATRHDEVAALVSRAEETTLEWLSDKLVDRGSES